MKFCKNCGVQLNDGIRFCPNCGAPAQPREAEGSISAQQQISPGTVQAAAEPMQTSSTAAVSEREAVPAPESGGRQSAPQQPLYQQPEMYQQPPYQQPGAQPGMYQQPPYQQPGAQPGMYQQPVPGSVHPDNMLGEAQMRKGMAILAYFGVLVLIPVFAAKKDSFARYHANQGLVLFIFTLISSVLSNVLSTVLLELSPVLTLIVSVLFGLITLVFCIFSIIGIVHAAKGQKKPLPIIGGIQILKAI